MTDIKVNFQPVMEMEANHPYIIKVSENITKFSADGVDITVEDEPTVDRDEYRTGSGTKKDPYVNHYNSMVGTYVAETEVPELCLFLSGNKFWYSMGQTKMKAFRAYFDFYDVLTSVENAEARVFVVFDGETTGIDSVKQEATTDDRYYNLNGQRVENPTKGLYIKNGKKVMIK